LELAQYAECTGFKPDEIKIVGIECDVSYESSVQKAFSKIIEIFGRIDSVVASAGIVENYPALESVQPDCF